MGKHLLRNDKTCLNCHFVVENRFCPNCGQENVESRKTFHHLFVHFFEDLTHYENAFWKTIRHLIFRPGALTSQYLSGKRMSYLAPVRLYIFISFVTFFLLSVLTTEPDEKVNQISNKSSNTEISTPFGERDLEYDENDSITIINPLYGKVESKTKKESFSKGLRIGDYASVKELDSVRNVNPEAKHGTFVYWIEKNLAEINEKSHSDDDFKEKFKEAFFNNIPKALFLYMPFFAFGLWTMHSKRKWYYFDHGIFTLHYFSFVLFTFSVQLLLNSLANLLESDILDRVIDFSTVFLIAWWFFYFFRSHRKFYGESRLVSRLKGFLLFFVNMFFIFLFIIGLMMFSAITIK
jgi:hypothetical protein